MSLPRFVVLRSNSNNKFLRFRHEEGTGYGFLQFSGEAAASRQAKFEVERSQTQAGLVHIRSCFSNKYWARQNSGSRWIIAGSDEQNENTSAWSCTLFQPLFEGSTTVRFRHVQLQSIVYLWRVGGELADSLYAPAAGSAESEFASMTVIDWETLCILPRNIVFKGDNDNYLSTVIVHSGLGTLYTLQFVSGDIGDSNAHFEVFNVGDGHVHIRPVAFNNIFWRRFPSFLRESEMIICSSLINGERDMLFTPIRVSNNVIALRNLGNNQFCRRFDDRGYSNTLYSNINSITSTARLVVEEAVLSRNINNVDFRLNHARIYNQRPRNMVSGQAMNISQEPSTVELRLDYTNTISRTWNASVSLSLGVTTTVTAGIPFIAEASISVSAEITGSYEWGVTQEFSETVGTTYTVTVPPMSRVLVSLLATEGNCDVPFNYVKRDTLFNGQTVTETNDDGVFNGINSFNFRYEHETLPLTADEVAEEIAKQQLRLTTPIGGADYDVTAGASDVTSDIQQLRLTTPTGGVDDDVTDGGADVTSNKQLLDHVE